MITWELIVKSLSDELLLVSLQKMIRYNNDGTDKVELFYNYAKRKSKKVEIGDVIYFFNCSFYTSILAWSKNPSLNKDKGSLTKKFESYVWIGVNNLFISFLRNENGKLFSVKNDVLRNSVSVGFMNQSKEYDVICNDEGFDEFIQRDIIDELKIMMKDKKRCLKVLMLVLKGFKRSEIASLLGVSVMTIHNDMVTLQEKIKKII
jgi:hypothetical protein